MAGCSGVSVLQVDLEAELASLSPKTGQQIERGQAPSAEHPSNYLEEIDLMAAYVYITPSVIAATKCVLIHLLD